MFLYRLMKEKLIVYSVSQLLNYTAIKTNLGGLFEREEIDIYASMGWVFGSEKNSRTARTVLELNS